MLSWIHHLDRILRREATEPDQIADGTLHVPVFGLAVVIDALGLFYGACMGALAIMGGDTSRWMHIPSSMVKVPALFLLTLIINVPSLYTFNALVGSRLRMMSVIPLLAASVAVMLAVLASLGTIVAFFSISTTSYPFMVLLAVFVFALSGILGLRFLLQTLHPLSLAADGGETSDRLIAIAPAAEGGGPPVLLGRPIWALVHATPDPLGRHVKKVFRIWLVIYAFVGIQMGWLLRPFISDADVSTEFFRAA